MRPSVLQVQPASQDTLSNINPQDIGGSILNGVDTPASPKSGVKSQRTQTPLIKIEENEDDRKEGFNPSRTITLNE